jgi:hypothetical protein
MPETFLSTIGFMAFSAAMLSAMAGWACLLGSEMWTDLFLVYSVAIPAVQFVVWLGGALFSILFRRARGA